MKRKSSAIKLLPLVLATALALSARSQAQPVITNPPPWSGSVAAGLTLTRGNSQTLLGTVNIDAHRKWAAEELLLCGDGAYGEDHSTKTAESLHGSVQYNYLAGERLYFGVKLDALSDAIADIDYRLTLSPLVGYYLVKQTNQTLAVEAGPGVVLQKLGPSTRGYATLRLAERYEYKFSDHARFWESFEIQPQIDEFKNYYWTAEIGLESGLTKRMSLRTYLQDSYYAIPAAGREKNDLKLVAAVAYKF